MKKILFGSASAILAVVGFSAFKSAKTTTTYYWFTYSKLTTDPGYNQAITTGDLVLPAPIVTSEPTLACGSAGVLNCKFGFTISQVNFTSGGHGIATIKANEVPVTRISRTN